MTASTHDLLIGDHEVVKTFRSWERDWPWAASPVWPWAAGRSHASRSLPSWAP